MPSNNIEYQRILSNTRIPSNIIEYRVNHLTVVSVDGTVLSEFVCTDLTFRPHNQSDTGLQLTYVAALTEWKSQIWTDLTFRQPNQSDTSCVQINYLRGSTYGMKKLVCHDLPRQSWASSRACCCSTPNPTSSQCLAVSFSPLWPYLAAPPSSFSTWNLLRRDCLTTSHEATRSEYIISRGV